ncbi:hypothetical protein DXG01_014177 [Tephrocybe rancida]|nr:hypothetical protein DXG01_014177 [Tephrocybe rancida]
MDKGCKLEGPDCSEGFSPDNLEALKVAKEGVADEEVVFTVYSIIKNKDLTPLRTAPVFPRIKFLKQSVMLKGLGTSAFDKCMKSTQLIHEAFDRSFPDGQLQEWNENEGEELAMHIANRFFMPLSKVAPGEHHIPFEKSINLMGVLASVVKKGFVSTEDNGAFCLSDIVAAELSFAVVPLQGSDYKMLAILRLLLLLDRRFCIQPIQNKNPTPMMFGNAVVLKRKVIRGGEKDEAPGSKRPQHSHQNEEEEVHVRDNSTMVMGWLPY